jgi:hypothetical protein
MNRIIVNGVEAELDAARIWRSEDEGLRVALEAVAGVTVAGSLPDPVGVQLDAAVRKLGARVLERDPYVDDAPADAVY